MSKRPVQNTLERSGFTVIKQARRKLAEGTGETSVIRDDEAHHLDGSPVTSRLIERNRRRWNLNSSKWMIDYSWLGFDYETGKAFCKSCSTGNCKTVWAKDGTYNVKTSAFNEHGGGGDHHSVLVVQTLGDKPMDRILKTAASMCNDAMLTLFRAAYAICERGSSIQNSIKTKYRNTLGTRNLEACMRLALEGPEDASDLLLQFQTNVSNRDALNRTNPITKKGTMTYFDII
ncbi:hypothetical protein R1sor_013701 [Riccia sorocarpa]|uniref:C17orf113 probable zinc finger domain-containing protein n=1 Tax=Riccia sorocarpa TaxID=122646 RepID=A0ABD3H7B4_9MARC